MTSRHAAAQGWSWVNEGKHGLAKWGWVSDKPGNKLVFKVIIRKLVSAWICVNDNWV